MVERCGCVLYQQRDFFGLVGSAAMRRSPCSGVIEPSAMYAAISRLLCSVFDRLSTDAIVPKMIARTPQTVNPPKMSISTCCESASIILMALLSIWVLLCL